MSTAIQRRPGISPAALLAVKVGSPNTQAAYRRGVSLFITWAGDRTLSARLFSEWIEELRKAGVPASTLRQRLCGGKLAIMQAATEAGMEPRAWQALKTALDSIKGEREASPEIRVLDGKERARLLAAMNERNRLVARFLYATAERIVAQVVLELGPFIASRENGWMSAVERSEKRVKAILEKEAP